MSSGTETMRNMMDYLRSYSQDDSASGRTALDNAVRLATTFSSMEEVKTNLVADLKDTTKFPDVNARLLNATGMIIGASGDYEADTGAITGANAGGIAVKNAASVVPEDGDLSATALPEPASVTPITYTGYDGKTFTFYVKWPGSYTTFVDGSKDSEDQLTKIKDGRYHVDLNNFDPNSHYKFTSNSSTTNTENSPTCGQMKNAIQTALKGLNNYWLREGAKLNYDSLGLALDGQTIEIVFVAGGDFDYASAITYNNRDDSLPSNHIYIAIDLFNYGIMNPTDPNGNTNYENGKESIYLDRVIAHEMVHAVMFATGTLKNNMPQFFTEGIADLVQGDDDYNSDQREYMLTLANNPDKLEEALVFLEGTGSAYAYPAGDMFLRYLAHQNLNITPFVGSDSNNEVFSYGTNEAVVTNYEESDSINYQKRITDAYTSSTLNDLLIAEGDSGLLVLRDVRGKTVTLNTPSGALYAYLAENSSEVNGADFGNGDRYEVLFGSNYQNDIIRAGNGGSALWGGFSGNDELFGGAGQDTFVYNFADGHDSIKNAEAQDVVYLKNMTIDRIISPQINDNGVFFTFTDGSTLNVADNPSNFIVRDPDYKVMTFTPDYQNKTWIQTG